MTSWILYGANGYTGELAAREAVRRGLTPILAGRNATAVAALGRELGLEARAFGLDDPAALRAGMAGAAAVLHCAGPFVRTSRPMVAACLEAKVSYLDITGEIAVFEAVLAGGKAKAAQAAGVALLPGVGFDVVPSDCLAARLARALPDASQLTLAFAADGGSWSRGTLKTVIESFPAAGAVRRGGRIVPVPLAWKEREIAEFPKGRRHVVTIPWGDVATAWHSTKIPDIEVYTGMPPKAARRLRRLQPFLPLAGWGPVKRFLQRRVDAKVTGPSAEVRERARMHLWGEARNPAGDAVTALLEVPEGYAFTAVSAIAAIEKVLAGAVPPGSWTPSQAFGADFVDTLPGVVAGPVRQIPAPVPPLPSP
jgi:short subunit dehydrogenase-like uncharacterized protein